MTRRATFFHDTKHQIAIHDGSHYRLSSTNTPSAFSHDLIDVSSTENREKRLENKHRSDSDRRVPQQHSPEQVAKRADPFQHWYEEVMKTFMNHLTYVPILVDHPQRPRSCAQIRSEAT